MNQFLLFLLICQNNIIDFDKLRKRDDSLNNNFKGGDKLSLPLDLEFETAGGR